MLQGTQTSAAGCAEVRWVGERDEMKTFRRRIQCIDMPQSVTAGKDYRGRTGEMIEEILPCYSHAFQGMRFPVGHSAEPLVWLFLYK